jgi:hypothetical protein
MDCVICGCEMRRLMRESFLQRKVYPLFGYYPWECPLCRELTLYKVRHITKKRSKQAETINPEPRYARSSGRTHSGISAAKTG